MPAYFNKPGIVMIDGDPYGLLAPSAQMVGLAYQNRLFPFHWTTQVLAVRYFKNGPGYPKLGTFGTPDSLKDIRCEVGRRELAQENKFSLAFDENGQPEVISGIGPFTMYEYLPVLFPLDKEYKYSVSIAENHMVGETISLGGILKNGNLLLPLPHEDKRHNGIAEYTEIEFTDTPDDPEYQIPWMVLPDGLLLCGARLFSMTARMGFDKGLIGWFLPPLDPAHEKAEV